MSAGKTVLVLGGGIGGIVAAVHLRRRLGERHRVVLVDRQRDYLFAPSLLWLMIGRRRANQIRRPLQRLERKGIEIIQGEIEGIDATERRITVNGTVHSGDYLLLALGADLAPQAIPGLAEAGHSFYTLAGAQSLYESLKGLRTGRLVVLTAAPAYKCPAAPYEAAMLLDDYCRRRHLRENIQLDLYAAEPGPMGVTGPQVSAAVRRLVEEKSIGYHPEHQVAEVDPAGRLRFANGGSAEFDLLAYVPPHRAPVVVRQAGLVDESGWVAVDRHTLQTRQEGVYAIGDLVYIPLKLGKPLPKAGVFAHGEAKVVAANLASLIEGKGQRAAFDGYGSCFVETGGARAGFGYGNFFAEPTPQIRLRRPAGIWHIGKVLFEKDWLSRWL